MSAAAEPSVVIVIPAYDAERHLSRVLPAARRAAGECEVVVVDAGSTDRTAERAEELGARVIRLPRRAGPAEARNVGVEAVDADVVIFIDSDCEAHPDTVKRVRKAFAEDPRLVSLTGSYDATPPERDFFSGYMNLRHHFTHQAARREGATFWAGCGAVRRDAFLSVGGFDADRYPQPQIEDIELGIRLAGKGRTALDPDLNVKHLKRWTLRSVILTDIFQRAVPWSRLILGQGEIPNDLNLRVSQRIAAALAPFALLSLVALPAGVVVGRWGIAAIAALVLGLSIGLQFPLLRCFARARGILFAAGGWVFQQVHLCYSAATFAACRVIR